jgi:hypothetical protein
MAKVGQYFPFPLIWSWTTSTYTEFISMVPIPTIHQHKLTLYFAGLQHKQKLIKLLPCFDPKEPVMTLFALQFDHGYYPWL